ncbi:MAG: orotidine-5'-phosphate decarboxylase [Ilumatobacteraceae bacterium]
MSTGFHARLTAAHERSGSLLCVGLDPDPARFPDVLDGAPDAIERFCTEIVDATADLVCAFKPQIAHFAAVRAEDQLERICEHIRRSHPHVALVLDAKRGDIGSTAEFYAREAYERYGADAVTVNPYLGTDAVEPFLEHGGVIALCRTSNPGASELQDLPIDGRPLYLHVAEMVADRWSRHGDCGLVVSATSPTELAAVRAVAPDLPILLPGVGAQGGDLDASVRAGADARGRNLLVSSSRQILYASPGDDFAAAARAAATRTRDAAAAALARPA